MTALVACQARPKQLRHRLRRQRSLRRAELLPLTGSAFNRARKKASHCEAFLMQLAKPANYSFCVAMKESKRLSAKRNQAT